jgi:hypothetical protein
MNTSWYINNQGKTEDRTVFSLIIKGKHNKKQKTENNFFQKIPHRHRLIQTIKSFKKIR